MGTSMGTSNSREEQQERTAGKNTREEYSTREEDQGGRPGKKTREYNN